MTDKRKNGLADRAQILCGPHKTTVKFYESVRLGRGVGEIPGYESLYFRNKRLQALKFSVHVYFQTVYNFFFKFSDGDGPK